MRVLEECAVDGVDSGKLASGVISPWSDALPMLLLLLLLQKSTAALTPRSRDEPVSACPIESWSLTRGQFVVRTNGPRSIYSSSPISSRNIQQCRCDGFEALAPPGLDSPVDQLLYTRRCPSPDTFAPPYPERLPPG